MNAKLSEILARIARLEEEFEAELQRRRLELQVEFRHRRVHFGAAVLAQQRRFRTSLLGYVLGAELRHVASIPFVFGLLVPMAVLDVAVSLYQWICFPLYRIPLVRRRDHWAYDRSQLGYLNLVEKINCAYCSYGNGLAAYFAEIAGRTEQYWCPIKHARRVRNAHRHYRTFLDYGDAEGYRRELLALREQLRELDPARRP